MRTIAAALLLLLTLPVQADNLPAACGILCGKWVLDADRSESAASSLDAALLEYREPRAKRAHERRPGDAVGQIEAEMERSLGPIHDRLGRTDLRAELLPLLTAPQQLAVEGTGRDILIRGDSTPVRRLSPGIRHTRIDVIGAAKIRCSWEAGSLKVGERYDGRHENAETYMVQRADGSLLVTREVKRPGLKLLRLRSVYRRA